MTQDEFNTFCGTLPHTSHVVQWDGADVWRARGEDGDIYHTSNPPPLRSPRRRTGSSPNNHVRALLALYTLVPVSGHGMSGLEGLASRLTSYKEDYIRESHRLCSMNLTKKLQKELGLNQGDGE